MMRTMVCKLLISNQQRNKSVRGSGRRRLLYRFLREGTEYPRLLSLYALVSSVYSGVTESGLACIECVDPARKATIYLAYNS